MSCCKPLQVYKSIQFNIGENALVILIPPLVVTIFANKYIIRGLSLGAVKQ